MIDEYRQKIFAFYREKKRMPSYAEIMNLTGLRSKSPVFKLVQKLVDAGYLAKDMSGKLIPRALGNVTMLSQGVSAGYGSVVEDEVAESVNLDEWLAGGKVQTYMMRVDGDSMKDAGILDGDSVLVEKTSYFKDGQIVVALMNDGYTIKHLRKTGKGMHLEPANKAYKPIYPTEDNPIELVGIVKTVIRNIHS